MEVRLFDGAAMNAGFGLGQDRIDAAHVLFERVIDGHRVDRSVDLADRMMMLIGNGRVIQDVIVARALLRARSSASSSSSKVARVALFVRSR